MCTSNIFTVNVSSVSPLPVNITLNGEPVAEGANLLRPLVKVWGSKVTDLDGTSASVELDGSAQSEANYVAKYMPLSSAYAGEALAFPLSEALQEGFYNLSASVSVACDGGSDTPAGQKQGLRAPAWPSVTCCFRVVYAQPSLPFASPHLLRSGVPADRVPSSYQPGGAEPDSSDRRARHQRRRVWAVRGRHSHGA